MTENVVLMSFYRYIRFKHIQMRIYSLFLLVWTKIWRGFPNMKGWGGWEDERAVSDHWSLVSVQSCNILQPLVINCTILNPSTSL